MLKIRLTRRGKKKQPIYRIVLAEHTMPVKGKFIEILGFYNPKTKEIGLNKEKIEKRLKDGACPSDTVAMLLRKKSIRLPDKFQKPKRYVKTKRKKEEESVSANLPAGNAGATADKEAAKVEKSPASTNPPAGRAGIMAGKSEKIDKIKEKKH
jgi:small subunit ribosomal protein S16